MSKRSRVPPPRSLARPPETSSGRRDPPNRLSSSVARPAEAESHGFTHLLALQDQSYAALRHNSYADTCRGTADARTAVGGTAFDVVVGARMRDIGIRSVDANNRRSRPASSCADPAASARRAT